MPNDTLLPCPICYRDNLNIRKYKVCVSDQLSIQCLLCKFTIEYSNWECLKEQWNTRHKENV